VITSLDSCELISADWTASIQKFQPSDIERVENRKTAVVLAMKPGTKLMTVTLSTKPDPSDALAAALTQTLSIPKSEIRFLALPGVLPSFKFPERSLSMGLHKAIMEHSTQLLQSFCVTKGQITINGPFVDVFTCLYRMRFRNSSAQPIDKSVRDVSLDIRRHLVVAWCTAIIRCTQPADTPIARVFFARLALNAGTTVAKAANLLSILCDDLLQAVGNYADQGAIDGVADAAHRIMTETQDAVQADLARLAPCGAGHLQLMKNIAVMMLSGIIVGMYSVDIDLLAEKVVNFTKATIADTGVQQAAKELAEMQVTFLNDMLGLLDGQRYDEPFQFIFSIWELPSPELGKFEMD
jgi:hypothetical protein